MVKKPTISLCMVTQDIKSVLARCLGSVRGLVDEVLVMDCASVDGTAELARELGATVFQTSRTSNYWSALADCIRRAGTTFILLLDPTEELVVPPNFDWGSYLQQPVKGCFLSVSIEIKRQTGVEECPFYAMRLIRIASSPPESALPGVVIPGLTVRQFAPGLEIEQRNRSLKRNFLMVTRNLSSSASAELREWHNAMEAYWMGDYLQAVELFRNCLKIGAYRSVYHPMVVRYLAKSLVLLGQEEEAQVQLDRGITQYKDYVDLYFIRGSLFLKQHRYDKAQADFDQCLELAANTNPNYFLEPGVTTYKALYGRGYIKECLFDYENALADYIRALRVNPSYLPALNQMVKILNPKKYPDYTVECLTKMFDFATPEANLRLAQALYLQGAFREAMKYTYVPDKDNSAYVYSLFIKALCLLRTRNYYQAAKELGDIPPQSELYDFALGYQAFCYWLQKYYIKARATLKQATKSPLSQPIFSVLGRMLAAEVGPYPQEQYSPWPFAAMLLPTSEQGFAQEVLEILVGHQLWGDLERVTPNLEPFFHGDLSTELAKTYYRHGYSEKALKQIQNISPQKVRDPEVCWLMGNLYRNKNDYEQALVYFKRLVQLWPGQPKAYLELAMTYQQLCLEQLKQGSERFPQSQTLQSLVNKTKENLRNVEEVR